MGKNVTVQIGDELETKMEKLSDVNWSEVVRSCLEKYCTLRLDADIEALAQKMKDQKEEAHSEGYKAALEWFKQEGVDYTAVNELFAAMDKFESDWDDKVEEEHGTGENVYEDNPGLAEAYQREYRRFLKSKVQETIKELPSSYDVTDAFAEGFHTALKKLLKES